MTRQLVLVHGRSQQGKESVALKAEWIDTLREGLAANGLDLPIAESDIRFPYYGDTLDAMVQGKPASEVAEVIVRGEASDDDQKAFMRAVIEEVRQKAGITDAEMSEAIGQEVVDRGPLNWEWLQGALRAIDRKVPFGSGVSIALATNDVYQYLKNAAIRMKIDLGVAQAFTPGVETVVVGHSLGTVVTYNVLRHEAMNRGWKVPLFVTVGSPLGVEEIRRRMRSLATLRCPEGVSAWFNAMDDRDVVALYPLTMANFPLDPANPAIENKTDVRNRTENRHGISGYLDDPVVAKRIYDALMA